MNIRFRIYVCLNLLGIKYLTRLQNSNNLRLNMSSTTISNTPLMSFKSSLPLHPRRRNSVIIYTLFNTKYKKVWVSIKFFQISQPFQPQVCSFFDLFLLCFSLSRCFLLQNAKPFDLELELWNYFRAHYKVTEKCND